MSVELSLSQSSELNNPVIFLFKQRDLKFEMLWQDGWIDIAQEKRERVKSMSIL